MQNIIGIGIWTIDKNFIGVFPDNEKSQIKSG